MPFLRRRGDRWLRSRQPLLASVMAMAALVMFIGQQSSRLRSLATPDILMAYVADADIPALLGKEAMGTLLFHLNFRERVLTLESLGADVPLEMSAVGRYLLNVADFPESNSAGKTDRRSKGGAKRVERDNGTVRNDALCFMGVTPKPKMRLGGKSGPSLTRR